ncbi:hypothetical protein [Geothrix sp. 21YS21S-4]|uniref:hypothetical protein n=1 Tax=Geothrix sp. 21YS21S-4 TaxID=3068889 RepID=UPI0027B96FE2|nr:hypothetical protein [Geothrix sp. 21YS21S-4]
MSPQRRPAWTARLKAWAAPALFLFYALLLFGGTALFQRGLFERDGYFHARLAAMMPTRGLSRAFPWTQLSTWREQFCDKEFLYHLAMAPFARLGDDPILGARIFGVLLSVAVLAAFYAVLRAHRVRFPVFFAALPLATGGLFIARLGMIRSHVLSMLLLMLGLHFLLERRWRPLLLLGFVYAWSYTVPFVLLLTAAPFALGWWAGGGRLDLRPSAAAGLGSVLGLAIHPYSPLTLETFLTYIQVFRLGLQGSAASGFELGNELYPYSWPVFFDIYPLLLILVAGLPIALVLGRKRLAPGTVGMGAAALFWFGMTAASPRFAEYSALLVCAAWALVARDLGPLLERPGTWIARRSVRLAGAGLALAVLAGFHVRSLDFYRVYQTEAAPPRFFTGACAWMAQHLPPGETVINLFWDDFPELFYDGARQTYLWGLDPTYSLRDDPARAKLLERLRRHDAPLDAQVLKTEFRARHLVLRANRAGRYPELNLAPFRAVYRDERAVVFAWE